MQTPFQPFDPDKVVSYVLSHTPEQMITDSRSWSCDACDLLTYADILSGFDFPDHVIALYQEGLKRLSEHPEELTPEVNVFGAYAMLGINLTSKGRHHEAIDAFEQAMIVGGNHPKIMALLAINYIKVGRHIEALKHIERILRIPQDEIANTVGRDVLVTLKQLTLWRLIWWYQSELNPIPTALFSMPVSLLLSQGVGQSVLDSLQSAFILDVSTDRKMWWVSFYDVKDPTQLYDPSAYIKFRIQYDVDPQSLLLKGFQVYK